MIKKNKINYTIEMTKQSVSRNSCDSWLGYRALSGLQQFLYDGLFGMV